MAIVVSVRDCIASSLRNDSTSSSVDALTFTTHVDSLPLGCGIGTKGGATSGNLEVSIVSSLLIMIFSAMLPDVLRPFFHVPLRHTPIDDLLVLPHTKQGCFRHYMYIWLKFSCLLLFCDRRLFLNRYETILVVIVNN